MTVMRKQLVVIGGGVIGLSVAFACALRGHDVTVLEQGECGGQASGAAAGMLAPFSENGEGADDFFRLCLNSLQLYPKWQQAVKDASGMDFEFSRPGSLYVAFHDADRLALETRLDWQRSYSQAAPEIVDGAALRRLEPALSPEAKSAIYHPDEAHVYAPHYVAALLQACRNEGVTIRERMGPMRLSKGTDDCVWVVDEDGTQIPGEEIIICTGAWSGLLESPLGIRIPVYPIRGQICAYELAQAPAAVHHMVYGSQGYVVPKANGTLVCGASEDIAGFDTTVTDRGIQRLLRWNDRLFPFLSELTPYHKWAGLRPASQDGYPLLGRLTSEPRIIMASGHYRNGILLSVVTGQVIADVVEGAAPIITLERFRPERFS